jgi:hypothetical protein
VVLCDAGSASTTGTSAGLVSVAVGTFYLTGSPSDVRVCASIVGAPFPPACANPVI